MRFFSFVEYSLINLGNIKWEDEQFLFASMAFKKLVLAIASIWADFARKKEGRKCDCGEEPFTWEESSLGKHQNGGDLYFMKKAETEKDGAVCYPNR